MTLPTDLPLAVCFHIHPGDAFTAIGILGVTGPAGGAIGRLFGSN